MLWCIKHNIFLANDSKTIYENICSFHDEPINITYRTYVKNKKFTKWNYVVVIDSRTSKWINSKNVNGIDTAHYYEKVDINHLKNFENNV